jgi:mercuric ion transport protein
MPKTMVLTTKRWRLLSIGLAALACVGVCALPLVAAAGVVGGGLALTRDSRFAPLAITAMVLGALTLLVWVRRARRRGSCDDAVDCGCAPDSEPKVLQPPTFGPRS